METRANYVLIGLFTLAVIVGAFGFVYWFHHVGGVAARSHYKVVFQGPIGGLRAGAQVNFNGIRVGEVVALGLDPADPQQSLVTISVDANTPVRADTRVSLEFQGLTGIATLALTGGAPGSAPLARKDGQVPVLTADRVASQDMMQAARDTLNRIDNLIAENQVALKNSIKSIETFTAALARNADKIDGIVVGIDTFTQTLSRNSEKVDNIVASLDTFTQTLAKNSNRVDSILAGLDGMIGGPDGKGDIPEAARAIRNAAENLDKRVDVLVSEGRRTLGVIEKTVRNFDENPTRLIFGGGRPANRPAPAQQRR